MAKIDSPSKQILQVENLSGGYKNFQIRSLSFALSSGDRLGVIGANGSGKSTLLKLIVDSIHKTSGDVFLLDRALEYFSLKEKAQKIAVVSQQLDITSITVLDYVLLGCQPHKSRYQFWDTPQEVEMAIKSLLLMGMDRYKNTPLEELSGGERQMVALARAHCQNPQLLLLDEPTSQLDLYHQQKVLSMIVDWHKQQEMATIMVIHDLNLAINYCSKLLLMAKGEVIGFGSPVEVITHQNIQKAYGVEVEIIAHPHTGMPTVLLPSPLFSKE